jgi:hypothetical protein
MNNISDEELLYELFAHRIQFMDFSTDELYIIRRLKQKLIELGYAPENLNNILYSFYTHFNILITMSEIESVNINNNVLISPSILNTLNLSNIFSIINLPIVDEFNNEEQYQEEQEYTDMPPLVEADYDPMNNQLNIGNLLNMIMGQHTIGTDTLFNQIIIQPLNNTNLTLEDVVVTTDENTLNTLDRLKITKDMNEKNIKCAICIEEMITDEEYFDIKCKHIFHKECLETYLKNYNHICPVCRNDIGESNPHI